ncbi:hypothetical protein [Roseiflexus castenholzii]|nr:hypothetical protein [Roseiflexus castenholzii]
MTEVIEHGQGVRLAAAELRDECQHRRRLIGEPGGRCSTMAQWSRSARVQQAQAKNLERIPAFASSRPAGGEMRSSQATLRSSRRPSSAAHCQFRAVRQTTQPALAQVQ